MASSAGETPYPIIKANATWGDSFAALNGSDGLAIGAYTAFGAGGGYYFGKCSVPPLVIPLVLPPSIPNK